MGKFEKMDKFGLEQMTDEVYEKTKANVIKNCKCTGCPTYVKGDAPTGYCFPPIGTSKKIQWEKECLCETCPIYKGQELDHTFYCTRCSEYCQELKTQDQAGGWG